MKYSIFAILLIFTLNVRAESLCDVRPGTSVGIKVVEFASGNVIHSKIPFQETTPDALLEEMTSLQDMGICEERIVAKKCTLKYEKRSNSSYITFLRGNVRWSSWKLSSKQHAENFVKSMKKIGFCS